MSELEENDIMLTTVDNPYNPFTNFQQWFAWDTKAGYNTASFLARICKFSDELSEPDQAVAIADAIREIVHENVTGMYRSVTRTSAVDLGLR